MKIYFFTTGTLRAIEYLFDPEKPFRWFRYPVICCLVCHPEGNVLIDTGWGGLTVEHWDIFPGQFFTHFLGVQLERRETAVCQIERLGLKTDDIKHIILSHAHVDHIGGVLDFPEATVHLSEREYVEAFRSQPPFGYSAWINQYVKKVELIRFDDWPYRGFPGSYDFFGDGTIICVPTYGHTFGHLSVFIRTPNRRYFFAASSTTIESDYLKNQVGLFGRTGHDDLESYKANIQRIADLSCAHPDTLIVPAHCPSVWARIRHLPEAYE